MTGQASGAGLDNTFSLKPGEPLGNESFSVAQNVLDLLETCFCQLNNDHMTK